MFKAEVQTAWLTPAPAEGLWEFSLQPEPGFIYIYHSASLHTGHRDALQQQTPTVHGQLIYCFHEAELINDGQHLGLTDN